MMRSFETDVRLAGLLAVTLPVVTACSDTTSTSSNTAGTGGATTDAGGSGVDSVTAEEVSTWIADYKASHPGNGGKDWDINAKTPAEIAADPDAQRLLSLCGKGQRAVIPELAWEYGGGDHQWIDPESSPLVMCVYIPVSPDSEHWQYDAASDHVTADVYVLFPEQNPCAGEQGADQVAACIGDATNFEILVDTASLNDGMDVGLDLSEASTDLQLVLPGGTIVPLHHND